MELKNSFLWLKCIIDDVCRIIFKYSRTLCVAIFSVIVLHRFFFDLLTVWMSITLRDNSFRTYIKFSEKLTILNPWYVQISEKILHNVQHRILFLLVTQKGKVVRMVLPIPAVFRVFLIILLIKGISSLLEQLQINWIREKTTCMQIVCRSWDNWALKTL